MVSMVRSSRSMSLRPHDGGGRDVLTTSLAFAWQYSMLLVPSGGPGSTQSGA